MVHVAFSNQSSTPKIYSREQLDALINVILNHCEVNETLRNDLKESGGAQFIKEYLYS